MKIIPVALEDIAHSPSMELLRIKACWQTKPPRLWAMNRMGLLEQSIRWLTIAKARDWLWS